MTTPQDRGQRMDVAQDAAVPSGSSIEMRSHQPYKRRENPMSLDTCVSRTPMQPAEANHRARTIGDNAVVQLSRSTATVGAELDTSRKGWSPDPRVRLGGVQRRSARRGEPSRTTARRGGSAGLPPGTVPVTGGVRAHLQALRRAGFALRDLTSLTGLPSRDLGVVLRSTTVYVSEDVARRIMSVQFQPTGDHRRKTPGVGARRRIQALVALGFPRHDLAARLRRSPAVLNDLPEDGLITRRLWFEISALYDELSMTASAPDPDVRDWARIEMGWAPPLAWDDDEIDDPRARPHQPKSVLGVDDVAIKRCLDGDRSIELAPDEVQVVLALSERQKWPRRRLAAVLGTSEEAAARRLVRYRDRMRTQGGAARAVDDAAA